MPVRSGQPHDRVRTMIVLEHRMGREKRRKKKAQMLQVLMPDIITWYLLILKRMLLTKQLRRR